MNDTSSDTPAAAVVRSMENVPTDLLKLNTHFVANAGLGTAALGGSAIVAAVWRLFHDLSTGSFILSLYNEHHTHVFGEASSQLVALIFGIVGAVVVGLVGSTFAYYGKPKTVPCPPDAAAAAKP